MIRAGAMLRWPAERYANKIAITYQGTQMTFQEVNDRVNRLANALLDADLQRGDRVAAWLDNSPRAIEVRFALMKAGLCMVALNVRQSAEDHLYSLNHADSRAGILDADYVPQWERIAAQCPGVRLIIVATTETTPYLAYEQVLATSSDTEPCVMVALSDLERIAYTSGTTGRPKGIMKTIGNDLARLRNDFLNEDRLTTADDVMLNVAPLTHAARVFCRKFYLRGARNIILKQFHEQEVFATIERERVTAAMFVPTMIIRLTSHPRVRDYDLSSLQRIFYGTAPMPANRLKDAIGTFGNILRQNYGLSEATQPVTILSPADIDLKGDASSLRCLASAGRPAQGVELRLIDEDGNDVAPETSGELLIRGDIVMAGYWNDPEATREVIDRDGWLHTGDVGYQDAEGFLYLVDRKKDMIICGGFYIYPREVERVIESHPSVQEVAVIGVPDDVWGEVVKAVIVLRPGATLIPEDLIELCRHRLGSYKKPQSIDVVDDLPKNFQGKILKRALRQRYLKP